MKTIQTILLAALLSSTVYAKNHDKTTEDKSAKSQQQNISLKINGLLDDFLNTWYLPGEHTVMLYLKPADKNNLKIDTVITGDMRLQRVLSAYLEDVDLGVKGYDSALIKVTLKQ